MTVLELDTPRFGTIAAAEDTLLNFPHGVIGLPQCRRFARLPFDDAALGFEWFQCVDDVSIAFLTIDPHTYFPAYTASVAPEQLADIDLGTESEGEVRCIVTVPANVADMTANLLAPIVVNTSRGLAKQVVLGDPRYATQHRLFPETEPHAGSQPPA